jgi:glycosyltransferase involved in cell wall biosynthesis
MKGRQRTLFLTTSYPRHPGDFGGHFVQAHARREQSAQRSVQVLAFGEPTAGAEHTDPDIETRWLGGGGLFGAPGVLPRLKENPVRMLLLVAPLLRSLSALRERTQYDRVIAHFLLLSGWPLGVLFSRTSPAVLEVVAHGSDVRLFEKLPAWLRRRIARDFARQSANLQFVSEELKARMARAAGSPDLQRYIEAQAVGAMPLDLPTVPHRDEARRQLGIGADDRILLIVGRLIEGKRVLQALRAALLVPNARVVALGSGPLRGELAKELPEAELLDEVSHQHCLLWMSAADALVCASREEGAPTTVREARSLGTAVIAVEAGDLRRWAERDGGIWMVD